MHDKPVYTDQGRCLERELLMSGRINPYEDLSLETVVEPGDIVKFCQPVQGVTLNDPTEYTHGIVVEVVSRYTDKARKGGPERVGVVKYTPGDTDGLAGGIIDIENVRGSGIPGIADYLTDELILWYKTSRETGYSPHNEEVVALIDHYSKR